MTDTTINTAAEGPAEAPTDRFERLFAHEVSWQVASFVGDLASSIMDEYPDAGIDRAALVSRLTKVFAGGFNVYWLEAAVERSERIDGYVQPPMTKAELGPCPILFDAEITAAAGFLYDNSGELGSHPDAGLSEVAKRWPHFGKDHLGQIVKLASKLLRDRGDAMRREADLLDQLRHAKFGPEGREARTNQVIAEFEDQDVEELRRLLETDPDEYEARVRRMVDAGEQDGWERPFMAELLKAGHTNLGLPEADDLFDRVALPASSLVPPDLTPAFETAQRIAGRTPSKGDA